VELIVTDAELVTMAPGAGPADSMLIRDGRIAAVGQAEAVRAAAPGADEVRLGGATVIPGLIDAHCHVADIGYLGDWTTYVVELPTGRTVRAARANAARIVERPIGWDDAVWLSFAPDAAVVLTR